MKLYGDCKGHRRIKDCPTCLPLWMSSERTRVKVWYNANADRAIAATKAWVATHRQRRQRYMRDRKRALRPKVTCGIIGCKRVIELRQRKFCRACARWFRSNRVTKAS